MAEAQSKSLSAGQTILLFVAGVVVVILLGHALWSWGTTDNSPKARAEACDYAVQKGDSSYFMRYCKPWNPSGD